MGESSDTPLKLQFDRRVRLDFSWRYHHLGRRTPGMPRA